MNRRERRNRQRITRRRSGQVKLVEGQEQAGRVADIEASIRQANRLINRDELDAADRLLKRVLNTDPAHTGALVGIAHIRARQSRLSDAIELCQRAVSLQPDHVEPHIQLGMLTTKRGRSDDLVDGERHLRIALETMPNSLAAHEHIVHNLFRQERYTEGTRYCKRLLEKDAYNTAAYNFMYIGCKQYNDVDGALSYLRKGYELTQNVNIRYNFANQLREIGAIDDALAEFKKLVEESEGQHLYLVIATLFAIHYHPDVTAKTLYDEYCAMNTLLYTALDQPPAPAPRCGGERTRLRVGLVGVGKVFGRHPGLRLRLPGLVHLNTDAVEVFVYSYGHPPEDNNTQALRQKVCAWRAIHENDMEHTRLTIAGDEIDILISVTAPIETPLELFTRRPAPIQVIWGALGTTGLETMDWIIGDAVAVPTESEGFYRERVLRMPNDYLVFQEPDDAPEVGPLPASTRDEVTFGCFNTPAKANDTIARAWAEILRRVPNSRLYLKYAGYESAEVQERLKAVFAEYGVAAERLVFDTFEPHDKLMARYNSVDIGLDPWPYSGGLTTCEALWMGVPVLACPSDTFTGRHAATHLTNAGLGDWVVDDFDTYIEKAVAWANDLGALAELRNSLRDQVRRSPLCDGESYARNFEEALFYMWRESTNTG